MDVLALLGDHATVARRPAFTVGVAERAELPAYQRLRHAAFVLEQSLFTSSDADERDLDERAVVLLARSPAGTVLGGVRLGPVGDSDIGEGDIGDGDIGWWTGDRLVVAPGTPRRGEVGAALIRAACAHAENAGALRFEAHVQVRHEPLFTRLGWQRVRVVPVQDVPHVLMRWPIGRIAALVRSAKADLGPLLRGMTGLPGFVGDDGVPLPGSDVIAACDAILPSIVERDPEWAGWCAVLVNCNDLAAMGAEPLGLLDSLGARDRSFAARVLAGLRRGAAAFGVPVLGGHTQLGVPASLAVTALGRTDAPVPGAGGRPGQRITLTADLAGHWRPGYTGRQWDSTSQRSTSDIRAMLGAVAAARPAAAKDVSMAGIAGTLGMLAEASGCGAVLDVTAVPRPAGTTVGDWLTSFPGFAMLTADAPGAAALPAGPAIGAVCGELVAGSGVGLRWPDGELTAAVGATVTGLGAG